MIDADKLKVLSGGLDDDSFCLVKIEHKAGELHGMRIDLYGEAAHFPSTANQHRVGYRQTRNGLKPYVRKDQRAQRNLEFSMWLLKKAILATEKPWPQFGDEPIHILAALADRPVRFDSHNFAKAIGDWVQAMGLTNDDTYAEIFCIKKTDYPALFPDPKFTSLIIQRRSNLAVLNEAYYGAIRCAALP